MNDSCLGSAHILSVNSNSLNPTGQGKAVVSDFTAYFSSSGDTQSVEVLIAKGFKIFSVFSNPVELCSFAKIGCILMPIPILAIQAHH